MKYVVLGLSLILIPWIHSPAADYFIPSQRVSGLGVGRGEISKAMLEARADLMIQSQTFSIMRDPQAIEGARRITSDRKLQSLFRSSAQRSGFPVTLLEAITYLESWGDPKAQSPAGPKGIMQISAATASSMGLKIVTSRRYRVSRQRVLVARKGKKPAYRTVTRRTPYMVTVRDDRMNPDRAIPAAANYLAGMVQKFGGEDWAIFAYHCGQGCVSNMMETTRRSRTVPLDDVTVPRMFFSSNPAWNRELYEAVQQHMQRDYSPTYYFRVKRAEELLALYRRNPSEFLELSRQYRTEVSPAAATPIRAPHRLSVWIKRSDLVFRSDQDIREDRGKLLAKAFDQPEFFGYSLKTAGQDYFQNASPAAIGTLTYIAYETRRLFDGMKAVGEKFVPLPVTSLVAPETFPLDPNQREGLAHSSGQVFDIDYSALPAKELECLRFVLSDLGWAGYVGFVEEGRDCLHIGSSPSAREFFATVYQEAMEKKPAGGAGVATVVNEPGR